MIYKPMTYTIDQLYLNNMVTIGTINFYWCYNHQSTQSNIAHITSIINMSNLCSFIFETMPQVLLLIVKVWVKDHALF